MKRPLFLMMVFIGLFSCNNEIEIQTPIEKEFVFKEEKLNLSELSKILGMHSFSDGESTMKTFKFRINGNTVNINGSIIDLNNSIVMVEKLNVDKYRLNLDSKKLGKSFLVIDNDQYTLGVDGKIVNLDQISGENQKELVIATIMFNLFDELKTNVSTFQNNILVKKVDGDDGGTFYGYTVGWGKIRLYKSVNIQM